MHGFLLQLANIAGDLALEHFRKGPISVDRKGRSDYVSHVDRRVEDELAMRIRHAHPDHLVLGEESCDQWPAVIDRPCWIIDPIDGTTNFLRGLPEWTVSIAYCDANAEPRNAAIFAPALGELFVAERDAGLWLGEKRIRTSGCTDISQALIGCSLPFRDLRPTDEVTRCVLALQNQCDDFRRSGSAALDLAYVASGRFDAYWELGIHCWDTAAGELLVKAGGGACSDFRGESGQLLTRRSLVAAASPELHAAILAEVNGLAHWLDDDYYSAP
ncbi:MAG: inositol monophosphatase family protein [Planctomycetota bacterium]|jgi:myo-inositol-1(or 4)-monophosphatase